MDGSTTLVEAGKLSIVKAGARSREHFRFGVSGSDDSKPCAVSDEIDRRHRIAANNGATLDHFKPTVTERTSAIGVLKNCVDDCEPRESCENARPTVKSDFARPRGVVHSNGHRIRKGPGRTRTQTAAPSTTEAKRCEFGAVVRFAYFENR